MARNRYTKVYLTNPVKGNLSGAMVVGNGIEGDSAFLLLERQVAAPRAKAKKAATKKAAAAATPGNVSTSFPAGVTSGA